MLSSSTTNRTEKNVVRARFVSARSVVIDRPKRPEPSTERRARDHFEASWSQQLARSARTKQTGYHLKNWLRLLNVSLHLESDLTTISLAK